MYKVTWSPRWLGRIYTTLVFLSNCPYVQYRYTFKLPLCTIYIYFQIALMYNLYIPSNCPYVHSIYTFKLPLCTIYSDWHVKYYFGRFLYMITRLQDWVQLSFYSTKNYLMSNLWLWRVFTHFLFHLLHLIRLVRSIINDSAGLECNCKSP